jgi:DNA (cytosine-5)-methyltransferase 1
MNVIDLFSGVGGFSTGLKNAGFNIVLANEIDNTIAHSYKQNHINTLMINVDIANFLNDYENIVNKNLILQNLNINYFNNNISNIDLIVGGPPCQGFSMAGGRIRKGNEFINDPRNGLFKQYFKTIQKFEPKFFIFENVAGILSMDNGAIIAEIEKLFETSSNFKFGKYYIQKKIFSANDYGVPQKRKRLIIIGSKIPFDIDKEIDNLFKKMPFDKQSIFSSKPNIHDAIADLSFSDTENYLDAQLYLKKSTTYYQKLMRNKSEKIYNHIPHNHSDLVIDRIKRIKNGQNWQDLAESENIKSVHSGAYGRLSWNDLSVTITTRFDTPSAGRFIHPDLDRNITPREAARLQSFPDDFIFYGNKTSICKQIGNAVPPLLAEFLGYLIKNINK